MALLNFCDFNKCEFNECNRVVICMPLICKKYRINIEALR